MKNALILHGTEGSPDENWFQWLGNKLEEDGYNVWIPQLPDSNFPDLEKYNRFLLSNKDWKFNEDSILIGHSSGSVAVMALLEELPEKVVVKKSYLVSAFYNNDYGWDANNYLFKKPFDYPLIRKKSENFVFIHSDNDPYCPLSHAQYLSEKLDGELIIKKGQKHFSVGSYGEKYREFPFLLEMILDEER